MYRFSRGIYRELAPEIVTGRNHAETLRNHATVVKACEATIERLATDRHYFARPARTLFNDIRIYFPMSSQERVCQVIRRYLACAEEFIAQQPQAGYDLNGNPLQCRATTRKGTPCQRVPLAHNGYCPSHQHLADTEEPARIAA